MKRRFAPIVLSLLVGILLVFTTFGSHGLLHLKEINNELAILEDKNTSLEREINQISRQVTELKVSKHALERKAREELGLSRTGEIVYIFSGKDGLKENSAALQK